jgi:cell division protein ZapA
MSQNVPVTIRVLDRDYTVGVTEAEHDSLSAAARSLDTRMREIRGGNRTASMDRIAVLTALNLAHELHLLRAQLDTQQSELQRTLADLNRRLDRALDSSP